MKYCVHHGERLESTCPYCFGVLCTRVEELEKAIEWLGYSVDETVEASNEELNT